MFERPPNGFFVRDLMVFNHLRRGGYVSKGFVFEPPDLTNSPIADLNEFQEQLCLLLASLHENQRLQVQYFSDSDYKTELLRYQQETERFENVWTKRSRNERFARYWQAMTERKLRRQRVILYVSRSLENTPRTFTSDSALREYYLTMLDQLEMEFSHVHHLLKEIFASAGTRVLPMSDLDHFKHCKNFLNPSLADRFDFDAASDFQPELSIQENCWHSEGNGQSDFGFFMDGHYHSVIALTRWPRTTYPGIIQRLTNLRLLDYAITVNVDPLPITQEINKEEKEHDRVAGDYASEKKISLLTVMEKKQKKIHALMQGQTIPFKALFVIRVWDKSKDGLNAKASAIKNAINSMNSAQYFESNLPTTSKSLFFQTWPGWTWGRYEHRKLYSEHRYLADMLPVTSTFTGHLATAEAIYDGPANNLIGVETFSGSKDNQSPQHAVLLGMSGAGKSVTVCDLLSQTEGYFAYTVIIEEGLSYGKITTEGRKAALDLRLMKPGLPDDPQSKVNLAVEKIHQIWEATKDDRLAQLVFCDLSTPQDRGFSVYRDMADKLKHLGVPENEIAFIQDYDADNAKVALFRSVRAGKVRVLFGSTQKMGSGTNVQERLIALHHLDAPWRPADVEQREGRILRQGNRNSSVQIYRYVTEGSFDAYMWQTLETKAKFIAQVMSGDMTMRRLEDMDSAALTYAEIKAIASGNPLVIEKAQVDAELIRLTRLRSAHAEEQYRIRSSLRHSHEEVETWTERLANLREDLTGRQDTSGDRFRIELDKQTLDNRGIAGELLLRRAEKTKTRFGEDIRIGRFAGFDMFIRSGFNNTAELVLRGKNSYSSRVTDTALGTIRSLESEVQGFEERAARLETDIRDSRKRGVELEAKVGAPFEKEERYHHLVKRQSEIEDQLDLTKNQAPNQLEAAENTEAIVEGEQPDKNETIKPKPARRMKV
ncbi:MAG TPA: hypothetical protein VIK53_02195 [Verrucomicrobiae bacterium]